MSWSKLLLIAVGGAFLVASPVLAQDDDMLTPLGPSKKKAKPKPKPKPRPAVIKPATPVAVDDELAPLTPARGELVLKLAAGLTTRRARVTIDDKEVGVLPIAAQTLSAGEHMVAVRAPGHATWTKKVTIAAAKPTDVTVGLEPNAAIVSVSTDTIGAQVLINGKLVGSAPIDELEVPPGNTTIAVRKEGYRDATQTVKLVAGKEYPISVKLGAPTATSVIVATPTDRPENPNLIPPPTDSIPAEVAYEESPPVYKRWYVWAGVAAVVAAVAIGTAVGVSLSQPRRLPEDEICASRTADGSIIMRMKCDAFVTAIAPISF